MPCPQCGSKDITQRPSGTQTGEYCTDCGKWLRWVPIGSIEAFVMPFGKHKGKTFGLILSSDPGYLKWASENMQPGSNIQRKATEILKKHNLMPGTAPHQKPINDPINTKDSTLDESPPW